MPPPAPSRHTVAMVYARAPPSPQAAEAAAAVETSVSGIGRRTSPTHVAYATSVPTMPPLPSRHTVATFNKHAPPSLAASRRLHMTPPPPCRPLQHRRQGIPSPLSKFARLRRRKLPRPPPPSKQPSKHREYTIHAVNGSEHQPIAVLFLSAP